MNAYQFKSLKLDTRIRYTSPHGPWIWEGYISDTTWKFHYITWTHSNEPVSGGPVTEDSKPITKRIYRYADQPTLSLI
jgi:hypothetical protein